MTERVALLAGATGLVGRALLRRLLADPAWQRVIVLSRRPVPETMLAGLSAEALARLDNRVLELGAVAGLRLEGPVTAAFSALGTTLRQAGSKAAFYKVDYDGNMQFAELARRSGARHFLLVSALGANARSPVFYSRVKGYLEDDMAGLGFEQVSLFRPSFLMGERMESRAGERVGIVFGKLMSPLWRGPLAALHPVAADTVAASMVAAAQEKGKGVQVYDYRGMQRLINT